MPKRRKSQLSITMIITAIIGLIILVAVILMISGKFGAFAEGAEKVGGDITKNCENIDSTYSLKSMGDCNTAGGLIVVSKDSLATSQVCCTQ